MALLTFSIVGARTPGRPLSTRSTVARLTPASLAMSLVVGRNCFYSGNLNAKYYIGPNELWTVDVRAVIISQSFEVRTSIVTKNSKNMQMQACSRLTHQFEEESDEVIPIITRGLSLIHI